jgi:hypothetical protein
VRLLLHIGDGEDSDGSCPALMSTRSTMTTNRSLGH